MAFQFLFFVQIEQLHFMVPALKSMSASKRTAPQWQLPVYVFLTSQISKFRCRYPLNVSILPFPSNQIVAGNVERT